MRRLGAETGFERYLANTAWLLTGRVAQLALGLVVGAWMTSYLGPAQYGVYAFSLSIATLFAPLANLGLGQIIVREVVAGKVPHTRILGTALGIRLAGTALGYSAVVLVLLFFIGEPETRWAVALASAAVSLRSLQILIYYFQAKVKARDAAIPQLLSLLFTNAIKVVLILWQAPMLAFVYVVMLDALVYSVLLWQRFARQGGQLAEWSWDPVLARQLLRRSWPLMFTLILFTVYMQVDQVMLKFFGDYTAVGWYAAAVRLSTAAYALPWVLTNSLFPAMLRAAQQDKDLFRRRMRRLYQILVYAALVLIALTWLFREPVVRLVYGSEFMPAAPVLAVHITAALFVFLGFAAEKWLIAEDRQWYSFLGVAMGVVLNIGLNAWLIPRYGIQGAAWATLAAQAFSYHLAFGLFKASRPVFRLQNQVLLDCLIGRPLWELWQNRRRRG